MSSLLKYPYTGKCVAIITGASSGFGRAIFQLICNKEDGILGNAGAGSRIILMSRNTAEMEKTKALVENETGNFEVSIVSVDLYDVHCTQEVVNKTLDNCATDFDNAFLFNNAGTLGDPAKRIPDYDNIEEIQNVFNLNAITACFLISRFCKRFEKANRFVIQTSTLAAIQPMSCMALYSASKASMDMFIRNLAGEFPNVRALNYAPGPMDTQMGRDVFEKTGDEGTKQYFSKLFGEGTIVKALDSVKKLMKLLRNNEFESGAHL